MKLGNSYVYFALKGDDFDPQTITDKIGIKPSDSWRKGERGKYKSILEYSCWKLSTDKGKEYYEIDKLVDEIVMKQFDKIDIINEIKTQLELASVLEIVLEIDTNPDISTPALGHDLKILEFLYKTGTISDGDIYRFDSRDE